MPSNNLGENLSREWDDEPLGEKLWDALQLIEHDNSAGLEEIQNLAERGSVLSMMYLGHALYSGRYGLQKDMKQGELWLKKAADLGSIEACYGLAKRLQEAGRGEDSIKFFRQAAERGYPPAMFLMGLFYYEGRNVEKNLEVARSYFQRAQDAGHVWSAMWVARLLSRHSRNSISWIRSLLIRIRTAIRMADLRRNYPSSDKLRG